MFWHVSRERKKENEREKERAGRKIDGNIS